MQYPSDAAIRRLTRTQGLTPAECEALRPNYLGPLFHIDFYRIILDEGHAIKNFNSQNRFP
jgi:SNF2 family DNA or RNA helicase